ncbi:MAG: type II secretion system protein, partial [Actinomycetota bacterium]
MTILAASSGALIVAGLVLLFAELTRRAPARGTPPGASSLVPGLPPGLPRRLLLALLALLVVLLLTRWPVAGLAAAAAVIFVPRLTSSKDTRRRTAALEALEQW